MVISDESDTEERKEEEKPRAARASPPLIVDVQLSSRRACERGSGGRRGRGGKGKIPAGEDPIFAPSAAQLRQLRREESDNFFHEPSGLTISRVLPPKEDTPGSFWTSLIEGGEVTSVAETGPSSGSEPVNSLAGMRVSCRGRRCPDVLMADRIPRISQDISSSGRGRQHSSRSRSPPWSSISGKKGSRQGIVLVDPPTVVSNVTAVSVNPTSMVSTVSVRQPSDCRLSYIGSFQVDASGQVLPMEPLLRQPRVVLPSALRNPAPVTVCLSAREHFSSYGRIMIGPPLTTDAATSETVTPSSSPHGRIIIGPPLVTSGSPSTVTTIVTSAASSLAASVTTPACPGATVLMSMLRQPLPCVQRGRGARGSRGAFRLHRGSRLN